MKLFLTLIAVAVASESIKEKQEVLEKVVVLHEHWYEQALDGLLGAVQGQVAKQIPQRHQKRLKLCSKRASQLPAKAKCLSRALDTKDFIQRAKSMRWVGGFAVDRATSTSRRTSVSTTRKSSPTSRKSTQASTSRKSTPTSTSRKSTPTSTARKSTQASTTRKSTSASTQSTTTSTPSTTTSTTTQPTTTISTSTPRTTNWPSTTRKTTRRRKPARQRTRNGRLRRLRGPARLAYLNNVAARLNRRRGKRATRGRRVKHMRRMPALRQGESTPNGQVVAELLSQLLGSTKKSNWRRNLRKLKRFSKLRRLSSSQRRLSEAVVKNGKRGKSPSLVSDVVELMNQFMPKSDMKLLSPRMMPVFRDDSPKGVLSPSVFGIENDGVLSLPSLMSSMSAPERNAWMDLIMQASGASKEMEKVIKLFHEPSEDSERNRLISATLDIVETWERVIARYTDEQRNQLDDIGYTFLDIEQLLLLYGPGNLYSKEKSNYTLDLDLEAYAKMSDVEKQGILEDSIRELAGRKGKSLKSWNRRLKADAADTHHEEENHHIHTLKPFVLAPVILEPHVLGPITLSPNVFSPFILSPNALSPETLSPKVGKPPILTPFVLNPETLSPSVLSPPILSPNALSPLTLNPYVLQPQILNPTALSPEILSPSVLSGRILSPFVLGPEILSPYVLNAHVLSPSVLSPEVPEGEHGHGEEGGHGEEEGGHGEEEGGHGEDEGGHGEDEGGHGEKEAHGEEKGHEPEHPEEKPDHHRAAVRRRGKVVKQSRFRLLSPTFLS